MGEFVSKGEIKMSKILIVFICAACLFFVALTVPAQKTKNTTTNTDVVEMVKGGLAESTIVLAIQQSEPNFDTSPKALIELSKQGVSQKILDAMLQAQPTKAVLQNKPNATVISNREVAATVNGKAITMEEVERAVKQQAQGQESKLSPLELAAARLQVLESLIQQEVMFQKAEKEGTVPTEEEITAEFNKRRASLGLSARQFDAKMKEMGETEATARNAIKRQLAIDKLIEKITGKIEPSTESEINDLFKGNPEMFFKKRGVRLAAIVLDPSDSGGTDRTKNQKDVLLKANEIIEKIKQGNADFATLAREYSEDPSKFQDGDLGYLSEADLKKSFGDQYASAFMNPQFTVGSITSPIQFTGKTYIFKLRERIEKEENLTLRSPNVRQQISQMLVENRKQLLSQSYATIAMSEAKIENFLAKKIVVDRMVDSRKPLLSQSYAAIAMNEAKIENFLAKKIVANINELSGARPGVRP
jgi:parvulin-like peptidyl-prolyl isomerase